MPAPLRSAGDYVERRRPLQPLPRHARMSDTPTWIQAVSAIAQSVIALATLLLSWVLWRGSQHHARIDYTRTLQESWNQLNSTILCNPKLAVIADNVLGFPADGVTEDDRSRRYFAFFALNVLEASYLGQRAGLVDDSYHTEAVTDILDPILRDPGIAQLLQVGGYNTAFVTFCQQRISALPSMTATSVAPLDKADELSA